jgi:hypothetical protein
MHSQVSGFAFSALTKLLSVTLSAGLVYFSLDLLDFDQGYSWKAFGWAAVVLCLLVMGQAHILFSKTTIDQEYIFQTWAFRKRVKIASIAECKLVYIPFLSWLITPRLVVRVGIANFFVFYAADPAVLQQFLGLVYRRTLDPFDTLKQ